MERLFIYVEGTTDSLFFEQVVKPLFDKKLISVHVKTHRQSKNKDVKRKLGNKLLATERYGWRRIVVYDKDDSRCFTQRKEKVRRECGDDLEDGEILVVAERIEEWYLAGLTEARYKELGITRRPKEFEKVTKGVLSGGYAESLYFL